MFGQVVIRLVVLAAPWWLLIGCSSEDRVVTATAAIQQAQKIQPMLGKSGKCLSELGGWLPNPEEGPGVLITSVKVTGKQLTFECDQEDKAFRITISYPRDDFGYVEGTFVGPLKINYWQSTALKTKVIPKNADMRLLAELLAEGE